MKKGKVLVAVVALILASLSPAVARGLAQASPEAPNNSPVGIFDNLDEFNTAVAKLQHSQAEDNVPEQAKQARREAISTALAAVSKNDRAAMNGVAKKFGLAVYDPNLNQFSATSYEQDVTISSPRMVWDNLSQEYGFGGTVQWVNGSALYSDSTFWTTTGNMGGPDGYGLMFSSIANDGYITSSYVQQWDSLGRYAGLYSTKSFMPKQIPGPYAFTIRVQDKWKGDLNGHCNCWRNEIWAWMKPAAFGSGVRNAYTYYAHDYKDTQLTGMEISAEASVAPNEKKVGGSFKLVWTIATEKWAVESAPPTMY
ncbi:MAG TPA: hypothetical protein VNT75_26445 [Symbiobacteriaceae bacterium]|nr:hypothetical protein [Symbiobacteriaceae bacterium]